MQNIALRFDMESEPIRRIPSQLKTTTGPSSIRLPSSTPPVRTTTPVTPIVKVPKESPVTSQPTPVQTTATGGATKAPPASGSQLDAVSVSGQPAAPTSLPEGSSQTGSVISLGVIGAVAYFLFRRL